MCSFSVVFGYLSSLSFSLGLIDLRQQQKRPLVAGTSTPFAYLSNSPTFMTMKVFFFYLQWHVPMSTRGWILVSGGEMYYYSLFPLFLLARVLVL